MRTYLILKEKAERWNNDAEIQGLLAEVNADDGSTHEFTGAYSRDKATALKGMEFDRIALGNRGMRYELLDQLTNEVLLGVR